MSKEAKSVKALATAIKALEAILAADLPREGAASEHLRRELKSLKAKQRRLEGRK